MKDTTVCVIGLGYIGLPTAALIADKGFKVIGVDSNEQVVCTILTDSIDLLEPGLGTLVKKNIVSQRLIVTTKAIESDVFLICVPTPLRKDGRRNANLDFVYQVIEDIAPFLRKDNLVIIESTCPVGTTSKIATFLENLGVDVSSIHIAYCPERVLPGNIMLELVNNDRVVGGTTKQATEAAAKFYRSIILGTVYETSARAAELCKLAENSYRDVNIAFANELSLICDSEDLDVFEVVALANRHPRVNILRPSPGVGGHCIAIDPWFLIENQDSSGRPSLIKDARILNTFKSEWVIAQILSKVENWKYEKGIDPTVVCFGLTFKPDIDDLRESPAMKIASKLHKNVINLFCSDPYLKTKINLNLIESNEGIKEGDILVFLVAHRNYNNLDFRNLEENKVVLDYCGISK